jgi:hypothetical protein
MRQELRELVYIKVWLKLLMDTISKPISTDRPSETKPSAKYYQAYLRQPVATFPFKSQVSLVNNGRMPCVATPTCFA